MHQPQSNFLKSTNQYNDINSSLHQQVQSVIVVLPGPDSSTTEKLFAWVFGGEGVLPVLL